MKIIDSKCKFLMYLLGCSVGIKKAALKGLVCLSLRRVSSKCCLSLFCSYVYKGYHYRFTVNFHIWRAIYRRGSAIATLNLPVVGGDIWSDPLEGS